MPTSYTSLLGLALPVTGELSGTWGDEVNNYITQYLDASVAGTQTISGSQTAVTLSKTTNASLSQAGSGATGSSQYLIINCTGNPAGLLTITAPAASKPYIVINGTSTNQQVKLVGAGPTTGVTLDAGEKAVVAWNGSDFVKVASSAADGVASISFGTTGLTPSTATTGAVTVAGTLAAANGGTGQSTYAVGDLLYASTTTALSKLADVATGNALISGGVGVAPSYGKIGLTTHVSGTLPVANGGTGLTSGTSGGVLYYSASGTLASSAALASNALVVGGGAGVAPSTITTGTGVVTALGVNTGTAGAFVVNGGALGTPSSGTVTNLTGTASININGTVGATTPNTGAFTSVTSTSASGILTRAAATQDGVELIGRAGGTTSLKVTLTPTTLTASRTLTLPDNSGTVLTTGAAVTIAQGGTGQTTASAAFNALSPITSTGDLIIGNGVNSATRLAIGSNGTVLTSNGTTATWAAAGASLTGVTQSVSPFETSLGADAGLNTTGVNNTWIGYYAGRENTTGADNTAVGYSALYANTTGTNNVAMGVNSLGANTAGVQNTAIGSEALLSNSASSNTAVGYQSLRTNTTGANNVAVGQGALLLNTTGGRNTASGFSALYSNTTADGNSAFGSGALRGNTTGTNNVAFGAGDKYFGSPGYGALARNTTGSNNTAVGYGSLYNNTTGADNTAVGYQAGNAVTTGTQNTLLGDNAGFSGTNDLTTGSNNTIIGYNAAASSATVSNEVTIGNASVTSFRIPGLSVTWGANTVPYRNVPPVGTKTGSYTLAVADVGKYVQVGSGGSITIPDATFAEGDVVSVFNNTTGNITITCTITTAYIAGTDSDKASVTLATRGVATILFISSTICVISGNVS